MRIENLKIIGIKDNNITLENEDYVVVIADVHDTEEECFKYPKVGWFYSEYKITSDRRFTIDTNNYKNFMQRVKGIGMRIIPNEDTEEILFFPGFTYDFRCYSDDIALYMVIVDKKSIDIVHMKRIYLRDW